MPLIPKLQAGGISKVVESANVQVGTGGQGEALQRLGQQLQNVSLNLLERTQDAEAKDYAANRRVSDTLKIEEFKKTALKENADNPDGYKTAVQDFVNTTYEQSQDEAPSGRAQQYYKNVSQSALFREQLAADEYASVQKLKNLKVNSDKRTEDISTVAYQNSDSNVSGGLMKGELDLIESEVGVNIDRSQAEQEKLRIQSKVAGSYFQGLLDNEQYEIARRVLNDANDPINKSLDVQQRSRIDNKLDSAMKQKQSTNASALNLQIKSATSLMRGGSVVPFETLNQIDAGLRALPDSEPVRAARLNLAADRALMGATQDLATTNRKDWAAKIDAIPAEVENAITADPTLSGDGYDVVKESIVAQSKNRLMVAMSGLAKEQNKDPAGYVNRYFPKIKELSDMAASGGISGEQKAGAINEYITQSLSTQKSLGIAEPRILSESESTIMAQNLKAVGDADAKSFFIEGIKSKYKDRTTDIMSELVSSEKISPSIMVAAMSTNPINRSRIISNTENQDAKIDNYRARFGQASLDNLRNTIKEGLKQEIGIMSRGDPNGADSGLVKDITSNIVTDVAQNSLADDSDGSLDDKLRNAKNAVLGSSVTIGGGNSTVMMPLSSGNNHMATQTFLDESNRKENIGFFNVALPQKYRDDIKNINPDLSDEEIKDRYEKQISRDSFWARTNNPEEIKLMYQHPVYGPINLKTVGPVALPIKVRFSEMKNIDFVQDNIGGVGKGIVDRRQKTVFGGLLD